MNQKSNDSDSSDSRNIYLLLKLPSKPAHK